MKKALVVFSGGQDSTTCLLKALADYGPGMVEAVTFVYGQKHELELAAARAIAQELSVPHTILDAGLLGKVASSSLLRGDAREAGAAGGYGEKYPDTFVDGRNMLFLLLAAVYAKQHGISDIITGVGQADFSGYPDCRDIFIKSLNVTLDLAMDYDFNIITPLMWLDKKAVWQLADGLGRLEYVKERTHSCYQNVAGGCGDCPACVLRERGYKEYLGEKDLQKVAGGGS